MSIKKGYTLVITEKPTAALRVARALDVNGKPKKLKLGSIPYFLSRNTKDIVVVSALGHLYTVTQEGGGRNFYPVFDYKWAPRHLVERNAGKIKDWIEAISKLSEGADEFINSCDYDVEGSLIGYTILKYACGGKEKHAKRMKFSTLTKRDLIEAYNNVSSTLDFPLVYAGKTRHEVDWLYGINLSRALTLSAKRWSGKYSTLSTGRVQGPTLKFLYNREKEILSFVPTPYWEIKARIEVKGETLDVEFEGGKIYKKSEADRIVDVCRGKTGEVVDVKVKRFHVAPPIPFDLGLLQTEAYRHFRYTPRRTLNIAERLYLEALISYPRTSSQKLPPSINYTEILKGLSEIPAYRKLAESLLSKDNLKPKEGKREDPAHPAIYPTGNKPERELSDQERRVYDLIVRRFMAVFGEPAVKESVKVTIDVKGYRFLLRGKRVLKEGWIRLYGPYVKDEAVILPPLSNGETVVVKEVLREDKFTHPPPRYNPASLLKKMEEERIGTKATRADIIQTLYDRGYITGERIVVTEIGFDVIEVLEKNCPRVLSVDLTRELEEKMEKIARGEEEDVNVIIEAVEHLKPILEEFKSKERLIGEALSNAIKATRMKNRIVGSCPTCGSGKLMILYSRKTGKRFIGCTNYFKGLCKTSFPLPQKGTVKPTGESCKHCGWPTVSVRIKGKRPWNLCFNPNCPSKGD